MTNDVGDQQEIRSETHLEDELQLVLQTIVDLLGYPGVAAVGTFVAASSQ
jgi:hypothetical protein